MGNVGPLLAMILSGLWLMGLLLEACSGLVFRFIRLGFLIHSSDTTDCVALDSIARSSGGYAASRHYSTGQSSSFQLVSLHYCSCTRLTVTEAGTFLYSPIPCLIIHPYLF
jgi:hypothetical protein